MENITVLTEEEVEIVTEGQVAEESTSEETKDLVVETVSLDEREELRLSIEETVLPAITSNYEKLKTELSLRLKEYEELEVTEDNLKDRKKTQKELASLRNDLESVRKKKKAELQAPIKKFDEQCGALKQLIEEVEKPLKDGISVFDEKTKQEKKDFALAYFNEMVAKKEISQAFAVFETPSCCDVLKTSKKAIKEAVDQQLALCEEKQKAEDEKITTIQSAIEAQNERIETKLNFDSFRFIIDSGASLSDILAHIQTRGEEIYQAEHKPITTVAGSEDVPTIFDEFIPPMEEPISPAEMTCAEPVMATEAIPEVDTSGAIFQALFPGGDTFSAIPVVEKAPEQPIWDVSLDVTGTFDMLKNLLEYGNKKGLDFVTPAITLNITTSGDGEQLRDFKQYAATYGIGIVPVSQQKR